MSDPTITQYDPIVISSNTPLFLNPTIILPTDQSYAEYIITGYQWTKNGVDIECKTLNTYTVPLAYTYDSGTYALCVTYMYSLIINNIIVSTYGSTCLPEILITVLDPIINVTVISNNYTVPITSPNNNFTLTAYISGSSPVYTWYTPSNHTGIITSSNTYTINPATLINEGNYYVTVTNAISSFTSAQIYINMVEMPAITTQPLRQYVIRGKYATFNVIASSKYLTYQWYKGAVPIVGAILSTYTRIGLVDNELYTVYVSNVAGTVISNSILLTVYSSVIVYDFNVTNDNKLQDIVNPDSYINVIYNRPVLLSVTFPNADASIYTYRWEKDGIALSHQPNSHEYYITKADITNIGDYTVTVISPADIKSVISDIAKIRVISGPIIVSDITPLTQKVIVNQRMYLNIYVVGGNITYQWRHNGKNIPGATSAIYSVICDNNTHEGSYDVVIVNNIGTITSKLAHVYYTQSNEDAGGAGIINAAVGSNLASGLTDAKIKAAAKCFIQISIFKTKESQCCPSGPIIPFGRGGTSSSILTQQQIQRQFTCTEATNKALILQRQSVPACPASDLRFVKYQRRGPIAVPMPPPPGVIIPSNPGVPTAVNGPCVNVIGISTTRF